MPFTQSFAKYFDEKTRLHGAQFASLEKVELDSIDLDHMRLDAIVKDAKKYIVQIETSANYESIKSSCSCAEYKSGLFCKHIWATFVAIEAKTKVAKQFVTAETMVLSHLDDPILNESAKSVRLELKSNFAGTDSENSAGWKTIEQLMTAAAPKMATSTKKRLIWYGISPPVPRCSKTINLTLMQQDISARGGQAKLKALQEVDGAIIQELKDEDAAIFRLLAAKNSSAFGQPMSRNSFKIGDNDLPHLLRTMAKTQRLFYLGQEMENAPIPLDFHDEHLCEVELALSDAGQGKQLLKPKFRLGSDVYELQDTLGFHSSGIVFFSHILALRDTSSLVLEGILEHSLREGPIELFKRELDDFFGRVLEREFEALKDSAKGFGWLESIITPQPLLRASRR